MEIAHYDGADVVVVDVRDRRVHLDSVSEVLVEPGRAVVLLRASVDACRAPLQKLGFVCLDDIPHYEIRSRSTDTLHWCGPVRLAWT